MKKYHWSSDRDHKHCYSCKVSFSVFKWKHHCRQCGHIYCSKCAPESNLVVIPGFFESKPVRHCNTCYTNRSSASIAQHTKQVLKDMTGGHSSKEREPRSRAANAPQLTAFKSYVTEIYHAQHQIVRASLRKEFDSFRKDIGTRKKGGGSGSSSRDAASSKDTTKATTDDAKMEETRNARSVCLLKLSALAQISGEYRVAFDYQKSHARMTRSWSGGNDRRYALSLVRMATLVVLVALDAPRGLKKKKVRSHLPRRSMLFARAYVRVSLGSSVGRRFAFAHVHIAAPQTFTFVSHLSSPNHNIVSSPDPSLGHLRSHRLGLALLPTRRLESIWRTPAQFLNHPVSLRRNLRQLMRGKPQQQHRRRCRHCQTRERGTKYALLMSTID